MAANKKPKKKYKPPVYRPALPINMRFDGATELKLQLIPHQYLENLRKGELKEPDWHALASRMNLGNTLAYTYFDDAKEAMDLACRALRSVWLRFERTGKWGGSGEELGQIGDGLNLTDQMQLNCTRRELDYAMEHVYRVAAVKKKTVEPLPPSAQQTQAV